LLHARSAMEITIRVRDVMDKNVIPVESQSTVMDAIKKMVDGSVWSLLVQKRGLPEGVVTERDVLRRCLGKGLLPDKTAVEKIMSSPLVTISPDATIRDAMGLMVEKGIRRLFVVDDGKVVGRVTQTDLFESTLDLLTNLTSLSSQL
jgi:CBS domain-containing protein